jgi:type VI protein secretion system component VasF
MMSDDNSKNLEQARAELENTLDAIEDKFNVGKRVDEVATRVRSSYESNPVPWIVGAAAAAVSVVAVIAWAILSDDD